MGDVWVSMGYMRYPLTFSLLVVIGLALLAAARVFRPGALPDRYTKAWIDAILFWGGFAVICGVLGTLIGIIIAAQWIEAAEVVSTSLVWGGIKVALTTSAFGLVIMAIAGLLWFGLQLKWRLLLDQEAAPAG